MRWLEFTYYKEVCQIIGKENTEVLETQQRGYGWAYKSENFNPVTAIPQLSIFLSHT